MEQVQTMTIEIPKAEHRLLPWIVCFSAALFFFYEFIQLNMFNAISGQLMQTFSLNAEQLGFLSANYFYSNLLFLFPAGMILDRISTRKVILISLSICVIGTFCFAISTNYYLASFFRFCTGIGSAFCFLSCIRLASRWFPTNKMALISGLIVTMAMVGGMIAQAPLTALVNLLGWRHALVVDAVFGAIILGIIFSFVQDHPKQAMHNELHQQINSYGFWRSMQSSYLNLQNWLCAIYTCLMNLPLSIFGALWGILYLEQVHNFSATQASFVTSMIFIGTIIGSPLAGWFSDKISNRRIPMIVGTLISLFLIIIIIKIPFHSLYSFLFLFFALGLITSTQVISYPTVAESNPHALTATSVSVVSFTTIGGYAVFQPLFGKLMGLHWTGLTIHNQDIYSALNFDTALLILPIAFFIALCAALLLQETHGRPSRREN